MKLSKTILITTILAAAPIFSANAADGTINFTGKILAATCKVNGKASGSTQDVVLGNVGSSAFTGVGTAAGAKAFEIALSECDASAKTASTVFDGRRDDDNPKLLRLTQVDGVAKGVGIGIYEYDSETLIPVLQSSKTINITGGTGTFSFVAKYVATAAKVEAGSADATATFTISYN